VQDHRIFNVVIEWQTQTNQLHSAHLSWLHVPCVLLPKRIGSLIRFFDKSYDCHCVRGYKVKWQKKQCQCKTWNEICRLLNGLDWNHSSWCHPLICGLPNHLFTTTWMKNTQKALLSWRWEHTMNCVAIQTCLLQTKAKLRHIMKFATQLTWGNYSVWCTLLSWQFGMLTLLHATNFLKEQLETFVKQPCSTAFPMHDCNALNGIATGSTRDNFGANHSCFMKTGWLSIWWLLERDICVWCMCNFHWDPMLLLFAFSLEKKTDKVSMGRICLNCCNNWLNIRVLMRKKMTMMLKLEPSFSKQLFFHRTFCCSTNSLCHQQKQAALDKNDESLQKQVSILVRSSWWV